LAAAAAPPAAPAVAPGQWTLVPRNTFLDAVWMPSDDTEGLALDLDQCRLTRSPALKTAPAAQNVPTLSLSCGDVGRTPEVVAESGGELGRTPETVPEEDAVQVVDPRATQRPVSIWRRMCEPEPGAFGPTVLRRWSRLFSKLVCRQLDVAPRDHRGNRLSVGSVTHAVGKPCRPCPFLATERGCFDGEFCRFCHYAGEHNEEARLRSRKRGRRARRVGGLRPC